MIISTIASDIPANILKQCIKNAMFFPLNVAVIDLQATDNNKIVRRNYEVNNFYIVENKDGTLIQNPKIFMTTGITN